MIHLALPFGTVKLRKPTTLPLVVYQSSSQWQWLSKFRRIDIALILLFGFVCPVLAAEAVRKSSSSGQDVRSLFILDVSELLEQRGKKCGRHCMSLVLYLPSRRERGLRVELQAVDGQAKFQPEGGP